MFYAAIGREIPTEGLVHGAIQKMPGSLYYGKASIDFRQMAGVDGLHVKKFYHLRSSQSLPSARTERRP